MDNQQRSDEALCRLAYSIGFFLGDGSVSVLKYPSDRYRCGFRTCYRLSFECRDAEPLDRTQSEITWEFLVDMSRKAFGKNTETLYTSRKFVCEFFRINTNGRTEVPGAILKAPVNVRWSLLAGMFDADGFVAHDRSRTPPRVTLGWTGTELGLAETVAALLYRVGVRDVHLHEKKKVGYKTCYQLRPHPRKFAEAGGYFLARRKQARLDEYLLR